MQPEPDWITVYHAANPVEAELVAGLLRSQGLSAGVKNNSSTGAIGELPADALETAIAVAPQHDKQARSVIHSYEQNAGREWYCQNCGETQPGSYEICWNCGGNSPD